MIIDPAIISQLPKVEGFDIEWKYRYTGTVDTDKRIMSFVDNLWGIEVTGGIDQFEPLTIIGVRRCGLARRAGIRVGDEIVQINTTPASKLTLQEAQLEIHESGRSVKIYVKGDTDEDSEDEMTVDFWFKPLSKGDLANLEWEKMRNKKRLENAKLYQNFPWNDRRRPMYKESNCYMVSSKVEEKRERLIKLKATKEEYLQNLLSRKAEADKKPDDNDADDEEDDETEARRTHVQFEKIVSEISSEVITTTTRTVQEFTEISTEETTFEMGTTDE